MPHLSFSFKYSDSADFSWFIHSILLSPDCSYVMQNLGIPLTAVTCVLFIRICLEFDILSLACHRACQTKVFTSSYVICIPPSSPLTVFLSVDISPAGAGVSPQVTGIGTGTAHRGINTDTAPQGAGGCHDGVGIGRSPGEKHGYRERRRSSKRSATISVCVLCELAILLVEARSQFEPYTRKRVN